MRKIIILFVISLGLFSLSAFAGTEPDEPSHWAKEAVAYLDTNQLIPDELFSDYSAAIKRGLTI